MDISKKVQRTCKQCGAKFYVYRSALEKTNASGNFCCRKCYNEYQKTCTGEKNNHYTSVKERCANCGKEIFKTPSKIKAYKNNFCSIKCKSEYHINYVGGEKNPNWKGGESKYRGDFDRVKKEHFSGTNFCAICGTTKGIHIHHMIPYRLTQDNGVDNLIPLCNKHHKMVEHATLKFIELFEPEDLGTAKKYVTLMLRDYQRQTAYRLKQMQERVDGRGATENRIPIRGQADTV